MDDGGDRADRRLGALILLDAGDLAPLDGEPRHRLRDALAEMIECRKRDPRAFFEGNRLPRPSGTRRAMEDAGPILPIREVPVPVERGNTRWRRGRNERREVRWISTSTEPPSCKGDSKPHARHTRLKWCRFFRFCLTVGLQCEQNAALTRWASASPHGQCGQRPVDAGHRKHFRSSRCTRRRLGRCVRTASALVILVRTERGIRG